MRGIQKTMMHITRMRISLARLSQTPLWHHFCLRHFIYRLVYCLLISLLISGEGPGPHQELTAVDQDQGKVENNTR